MYRWSPHKEIIWKNALFHIVRGENPYLVARRGGGVRTPSAANLLLGLLYAKEPSEREKKRLLIGGEALPCTLLIQVHFTLEFSAWEQWFSFQVFRRGALATTTGVTKPHVGDCTKCHPNLYILIPKLGNSIQCLWCLGITMPVSFTKIMEWPKNIPRSFLQTWITIA